ncbi:Glutathionyl-hydroquinone reductase [Ascochyta rabiei]|uniref:Uncharacterized protein n=1 Tax=Didymella rabiei TaxID=5454 RepID=A0A163CCT5_DIDRA|nr:Glutathionyl-hydroquinone reductase [Ascochyta rabiei]KZM22370.1 hypothetical protein ST47_g6475 [Ascochyta rabiei]UPX17356.1 Glutathionyl-hydroquinone reductase [Ascochyta rabiei]
MATEKNEPKPKEPNTNGVSEEDARKESSKVAKQATEAQKKATELMEAAAAAGDPDERQKLMEQALEQQIQSKSLGKTAKYLRSGTFQGMAVGAGLGIAPGASLGAITGTLVGGVSSTALGGLGAGIGAATGALHGPFWDLGKGAGKGIQKITNNLPGWKATESQKKQLEKMIGQINEQETPGKDELESWTSEGASDDQKEAMETAKSAMPSLPSAGRKEETRKSDNTKDCDKEKGEVEESRQAQSPKEKSEDNQVKRSNSKGNVSDTESDGGSREPFGVEKDTNSPQEHSQEIQSNYKDAAVQTGEEGRKKPRKLQADLNNGNEQSVKPVETRKKPRKLEKRSA